MIYEVSVRTATVTYPTTSYLTSSKRGLLTSAAPSAYAQPSNISKP
jgi:hypothetical protein